MQHILIIENEDSDRDALGRYSEALGYKPILISDPSVCKALNSGEQKCSTNKPCANILLIDKELPAIDGLSLIERQIEKGCKVASRRKALMASTMSEQDQKIASRLGFHVLQKPVTSESLENWLNGLEV